MVKTARYGEWASPITTELLVAQSVRLGAVAWDDGEDGECVCWLEGRPSEGGRNVLVRCRAGEPARDMLPAPFDARTRAHEYGGGAFVVDGGELWFTNNADQRIHHCREGTTPAPLTAEGPARYADLILDRSRRRIICVREDHGADGEPENALVAVGLDDGAVSVLAAGHDFYSSPALSEDGRRLAWITWDHPDMPWDANALWVAELDGDGALGEPRRVAGGPACSTFQPAWAPDGRLWYAADHEGWWNLHCFDGERARCVLPMAAEFARPQWVFAMTTFGFDDTGRVVCCYTQDGLWHLARLEERGGGVSLAPIACALTDIQAIAVRGREALVLGGSRTLGPCVARVDLDSGAMQVLREAQAEHVDAGYLSTPEPVSFPTADDQTAHGFFYPPRNADFGAPPGEKPPLIVVLHGGPTSATSSTLKLALQFWTSRGFAVLDVNYRGSTGYGRAYRELLDGRWGVADVEDCVHGARWLAAQGRVDGTRLLIRGGSAGGYTTLAALAFHDTFAAGASYYGVSDLEALAEDTHKFESRYLDRLIGPYPQMRARYRERSPIHAVDRLSCPVIFFQGLEDAVVPSSQAEMMVEALRAKGIPVAYLAFAGEQHGFRKAETIRRTLEAELVFYARVLGFTPAGDLPALDIENIRGA